MRAEGAQVFPGSGHQTPELDKIARIWTDDGWLCLAVVRDLYSRRVIGYAMSKRIDRARVISALRMALFRRQYLRGVIVHSDRGKPVLLSGLSSITQSTRIDWQHA